MIVDIIKRTAVIDVRIGPRGRAGINGTNGTNGQGVPTGGTTGQVLAKNSGTNYDTGWIYLNLSWDGISGKPSTFPPSSHNQAWATITGTPTTLAGYGIADGITASAAAAAYAPIDHTQAIGTITGLQSALDDRVLSSFFSIGGDADTVALRDASGGLTSFDFSAYDSFADFSTRVSAGVLSLIDTTSGNVMNITPPSSLSGPVNVQWPSTSGTLLNALSNLPAANLTGTINTARLPATITGLTSVTSTTFVGALTGTASGNLALTGGTITGALTLPNAILSGLSLTGSQATNTIDVSTTWNTTGSPTLIYGRATNTASGANADLLNLGTTAGALFRVTKAGVCRGSSYFDSTGAYGLQPNIASSTYLDVNTQIICRNGNSPFAEIFRASGTSLTIGSDLIVGRSAAASLQLGANHATTATNQTIKAHNVTTGIGANLILSGGTGSVASGVVIISRLPTSNPGPGILWNNSGTPAIGT